MKPIKFPGSNVTFGENQPDYEPLPALMFPDGEVLTCWQLSDEEIENIVKTKKIYIKQLTFKKPLQPLLPITDLDENIKFLFDDES
jgi:hypothetical protein